MSVPFHRRLHVGCQGGDVRALQRALHKAGYRGLSPTGDYRDVTRREVVQFQKHHGIRLRRGIVRENTWHALQPYFDGYDGWLVNHWWEHRHPPIQNKIDRFVKTAWLYYSNRPLRYYQQRPMQNTGPPPNIDRYLDCSEYVYVCAKAAGLPDPSGLGYTGYGNTYSFLAHMRHTSNPRRGDLVFYDNPSHVAIIVGEARGGVLMVLSNGSDYGPRYLNMRYRTPVAYRTWRTG